MKNNRPSTDGFVPRRPRSQLGELQNTKHPERQIKPIDRSLHTGRTAVTKAGVINRLGVGRKDYNVGEAAKYYDEMRVNRGDLNASLSGIDDEETGRRHHKRRKVARFEGAPEKPRRRRRKKIILAIVIALVVIILAIGGYLVFTVLKAGGNVLQGNLFDIITQTKPLQQDANGRSNFLVVGTSEDDPGHDAGWLTDSILVVSVDQKNKNAYMFSVPRDLYVDYGMACFAGYKNKINGYFNCINDADTPEAEQERLTGMSQFVGDIVGMDIQYAVHVNYTVVRDVINAIGGSITVNIEGNGATPAGIPAGSVMDANFDWKCGASYSQRIANCPPRGHFIDYGPGPQSLDAEHALYLAQSRGDADNWGLAQSDFDRQKNQQKIVIAMKEKALSAGTLTNLGSVTGLINALGSNLRTNIPTDEIRTLMSLATDIPSSSIKTISLIDAEPRLLSTGSPVEGAGSIVFPTAGLFEYGDIQAYIAKKLSSDPVVAEEASISVWNGSGVAGAAQAQADKLTAKNYTVGEIADAPEGEWPAYSVYQITKDKPETGKALAKLYGVTLITSTPPFSVNGDTDYVVIVGPQPTTTGQ